MKIIGIRPSSFTSDKGELVSGQNIYVTYPLSKGVGQAAERIFCTDAKVNSWGYVPVVGDEVEVSYNRYGKVDTMRKVK